MVLEIRATPGHTPESISVVVYEHADDEAPYGVLTGDTLFIGDVGRPDLLSSVGITADDLASKLYHSIQDKLLTLPDVTRVFPAHGAGSACGKNLSTETQSTIGEQRATNYALKASDETSFVKVVTDGQSTAPAYFAFDAVQNRKQRDLLTETEPPTALTLDEVLERQRDGAVVVDVRERADFAAGHLVGSINIGADGRFAEYAGSVLDHDTPVVLVADDSYELEAKIRMGRIGFDNVVGHLADPIEAFMAHQDVVARQTRLTAVQLADRMSSVDDLVVLDIRQPGETALGTIEGAATIPLFELTERLGELDPSAPTVVYCAGGYRSMIGASYLRAHGFTDVSDLLGGYDAWTTATAGGEGAEAVA